MTNTLTYVILTFHLTSILTLNLPFYKNSSHPAPSPARSCNDLSHDYLLIYLSLSLSPSLYLSFYLSICLSDCLSVYLAIYLPINLSIYLPIYLSIHPSIYLFLCPSIDLFIYPSIYLSSHICSCLGYIHVGALSQCQQDIKRPFCLLFIKCPSFISSIFRFKCSLQATSEESNLIYSISCDILTGKYISGIQAFYLIYLRILFVVEDQPETL